MPKANAEFWRVKRLSNVEWDKRNVAALDSERWEVFTVWECMTKPAQVGSLPSVLEVFLT